MDDVQSCIEEALGYTTELDDAGLQNALLRNTPALEKLLEKGISKDDWNFNLSILAKLLTREVNVVLASNTKLLPILLSHLCDGTDDIEVSNCVRRLMQVGVGTELARWILTLPLTRLCNLVETLVSAMDDSFPAHFHFDTTEDGYASVEFANLPSSFPPDHNGYSFCTWLYINKKDDAMHITIFGAFDTTRQSFTMLYIEKMTGCLILQTSLKTSVRFPFQFQTGLWYNIAVVHKRSTATSSSRASLFVNAQLTDTLKIAFPSKSIKGPLRAFIGTLKSFAPPETATVRYSIGQTILVEQLLGPDLLHVYFQLGKHYSGNFQDLLGGFMTYSASAAINLRIEEQGSSNLRSRNSENMPAAKIIFSVAGHCISTSTKLPLDQDAQKHITDLARLGHQKIVLNRAIIDLSRGLASGAGVGLLAGGVVCVSPVSFGENVHKLGGMSSLLYLVEEAKTPSEFLGCIKLCLKTINLSFINSDDMEKIHGYERLAQILKQRHDSFLTEALFATLLEFVGIEDEIIINPLAYRFLIVDFEIWHKATFTIRRSHLNQFRIFSTSAKYGKFNNRRLTKMNVVKKLLLGLRANLDISILIHCISAFKSIVEENFHTETIRTISTFIIHSLDVKQFFGDSKVEHLGSHDRMLGLAVLEMLDEILAEDKTNQRINKFATTITNRWVLLLLSDPDAMPAALRILSRLLATQGRSYVAKFGGKNDGFHICQVVLERRFLRPMWPVLFAAMLASEIPDCEELAMQLDHSRLIEDPNRLTFVVENPETFFVILRLIRRCALHIVKKSKSLSSDQTKAHARTLSLDAVMGEPLTSEDRHSRELPDGDKDAMQLLESVTTTLTNLFVLSESFSHLCGETETFRMLVECVFYLVCGTGSLSAETELQSQTGSTEVTVPVPIEGLLDGAHSGLIVGCTGPMEKARSECAASGKGLPTLRPDLSFVFPEDITDLDDPANTPTRLSGRPLFRTESENSNLRPSVSGELMHLVTLVISNLIFSEHEFRALDLIMLPPAIVEHRLYFLSVMQEAVLKMISQRFSNQPDLLTNVKIIANIANYTQQLYHSILQGAFLHDCMPAFDFLARVVEFAQAIQISDTNSTKAHDLAVLTSSKVLQKFLLLQLSDTNMSGHETSRASAAVNILQQILYFQRILFGPYVDVEFLRLLFYQLYQLMLLHDPSTVGVQVVDVWRAATLLQKDNVERVFKAAKNLDFQQLSLGLNSVLELDSESFLNWISDNRIVLESFLVIELSIDWTKYVQRERKVTVERGHDIAKRRKEFLKFHIQKAKARQEIARRYEFSSLNWLDSILESESSKLHKSDQDQQDQAEFVRDSWIRQKINITREKAIYYDPCKVTKWRLDLTECRFRQRKKLRPIDSQRDQENLMNATNVGSTVRNLGAIQSSKTSTNVINETEYDMIQTEDFVQASTDSIEDRNRKVLRSLEHGDIVQEVFNISRIVGLQAVEALLILGKNNMYLIDNYFVRADGEVVDIYDPTVKDSRDAILQVLAGQVSVPTSLSATRLQHECRTWSYDMIISTSKRQFLFRDVAFEIFFKDGRSFLITTFAKERDIVHRSLVLRTKLQTDEDLARKDTIQNSVGSFGSRLMSVFVSSPWSLAAKRWERHEISNFQYLMIINTLAGRSYNDLTQYPVFPWVLADYSSEDLDLSNPATFRDLSKNMGSQTAERREEFRSRYESFGDIDYKPFNFGTHYSSAMIVCSYLIRLIPFVDSYLLLQGGHFDHPERLFHSIEKTWLSASRDNMTDVRELTPEWFYLPEFLINSNRYDFGAHQKTGQVVDDVILPPWAKNSPQLFIERHREALESDYVSSHLQEWIDLIFGYKQLGTAAVDNVNVFHSLSYHGSIDLDRISDPVERLATIGIIHNFGQTPRQVFNKPHGHRIATNFGLDIKRTLKFLSTQRRAPHADLHSAVARIELTDSLKATPATTIHLLSNPGVKVEFATSDSTLRIYSAESGSVSIFEYLHSERITHATATSNVLVLGSADSLLSIWKVKALKSSYVSLQNQGYLRGHLGAIETLCVSEAFALIVSGCNKGMTILWDLNRSEYVRTISEENMPITAVAVSDLTGLVVSCTKRKLSLYTVNGCPLLSQDLLATDEDISAVAFYPGRGDRWHGKDILFTGHTNGFTTIWSLNSKRGESASLWSLTILKVLQHQLSCPAGAVTCFKAVAGGFYTGDSIGNVFQWT